MVVEVEAQAVEVAEVEAVARHKSRVLMKRAYVLAAWIGFAWFSHRFDLRFCRGGGWSVSD